MSKTPKVKPKKRADPYKKLKFMGYMMSQLPNPYTRQDLLRYAKFQLAIKSHRLLLDPIWDLYTEEEILMEYFAHQMDESDQFRQQFESTLGDVFGVVDEFSAWADKQMAEEAKIRDKVMGETEDSVSFNPGDVMGDGE